MALQPSLDTLFERLSRAVPSRYMRALADAESGTTPNAVSSRSSATGLLQITQTALTDYNRRKGLSHELTDLLDPALNITVADDHLKTILAAYRARPALAPDWESRRFVELVTMGWNAGHNAVVQVVGRLEGEGIPPERITVDTVSQAARALGAEQYLADANRVAFAKKVAARFFVSGGPWARRRVDERSRRPRPPARRPDPRSRRAAETKGKPVMTFYSAGLDDDAQETRIREASRAAGIGADAPVRSGSSSGVIVGILAGVVVGAFLRGVWDRRKDSPPASREEGWP